MTQSQGNQSPSNGEVDHGLSQKYEKEIRDAYKNITKSELPVYHGKLARNNKGKKRQTDSDWIDQLIISMNRVNCKPIPSRGWFVKLISVKKGKTHFDPAYLKAMDDYIRKSCKTDEEIRTEYGGCSEEVIQRFKKELWRKYKNGELTDGLKQAREKLRECPDSFDIQQMFFRFSKRLMNYSQVRQRIESYKSDRSSGKISDLKWAHYNLELFECEFREALSFRHNRQSYENRIRNARDTYLELVPDLLESTRPQEKQADERLRNEVEENYHYWRGRFFLELWWINAETSDWVNLQFALSEFDEALKVTPRWWLMCYRCIALKVIDENEFHRSTSSFQSFIKQVQDKEINKNQYSIKVYRATSFILEDNPRGLKKYLDELGTTDNPPSDFHDTIFHHIELIYPNDVVKQKDYTDIMRPWVLQHGYKIK